MSLSSGKYLSAKEEFEQERPTSPAYEQWIIDLKTDDCSILEDQRVEDRTTCDHQIQDLEGEPSDQPDRSEIVVFDSSIGQ